MRRHASRAAGSLQRSPQPSNGPGRRRRRPQIQIRPGESGYAVLLGNGVVRDCDTEADAHHWGMHVFDAVNRGLDRPSAVRTVLLHICLRRQQEGTHPPVACALPQIRRDEA